MNLSPWVGIGLMLFLLVGLLGVLRLVQLRYAVSSEFTRKALHVTMGLTSLTLPWLFAHVWPVVLLTGISVSLFAAMRFLPPLRCGIGAVIYSVERESLGEFYFPAGILAVFAISHDDGVLYSVSILTLALADSAAALVGMRCRRSWYWRRRGVKTIQGSLAFFLVTLVCAFLILRLQADKDNIVSLLVAINLALLLMAVEGCAHKGLDNVLVPVSAVVMLQWLLTCSVFTLLLILVCLVVVAVAWPAILGGRASAPRRAPPEVRKPSPGTNRATSVAS